MRPFTRLFWIFLLVLCPGWAGAGTLEQWDRASAVITAEQGRIKADIDQVRTDIAVRKKALKKEAEQVSLAAKKAKRHAQNLEKKLTELRQEEKAIKTDLAQKEKSMAKIQDTVWDSAGIFRRDSPLYSGQSLPQGWLEKTGTLAAEKKFPRQSDIDFLLACLLGAIKDSGQVDIREDIVYMSDGQAAHIPVLRFGTFQAFSLASQTPGFLLAGQKQKHLEAAPYKPGPEQAGLILDACQGSRLPLDLSGGKFLKNPPEKQTVTQRLLQGGIFIWPILGIAVIGLILVIERLIFLSRVRINGKTAVTTAVTQPSTPAEHLVHALMARGENKDAHAMETRMEKAIIAQLPPLERFLQTIKIFATVSPLLGLLGTVSGIIQTFRIITAFGNGDPKLLSSGISEALLTTEMGLLVAIPLLLCHHFLSRRVAAVILDMEYAGMALIAAHAREMDDNQCT